MSNSNRVGCNSNRSGMSNSNRVGCNTSSNNLAVMSNNSSTLVNLGRGLLTGSGHDLLTVLGDGGVDDLVVLLMAFLSWGLNVSWVTGLNWNTVAHRGRHSSLSISIVTSLSISLWLGLGISLTSDQESLGESNTKEDREELHCLAVFVLRISLPTFHEELKKLKEKQAKRKEIRAEQEKKLNQQKKEEEE